MFFELPVLYENYQNRVPYPYVAILLPTNMRGHWAVRRPITRGAETNWPYLYASIGHPIA
jgi:hypothetical protein